MSAFLSSSFHGLGQLISALAGPHGFGVTIHNWMLAGGVIHEPVQQTNALRIDVRSNNGIPQGKVLVIIKFTQCLAAVIEGLAVTQIMFSIATLLSGEHTVRSVVLAKKCGK